MCFSAEISFTAAGILGILGTATLKNQPTKPYFYLAAIPFLFGLQQLSEGVLWTELGQVHPHVALVEIAKWTFILFAFLVWPIWIPLSLFAIEKVQWRRQLIGLVLVAGTSLSLTNLYYGLGQPIGVNIINHSIQYVGHLPLPSETYTYPSILIIPTFLSSLNRIWIFGALALVTYAIASYFYSVTFISVWCFFAAVVSSIIFKILRDSRNESQQSNLREKNQAG